MHLKFTKMHGLGNDFMMIDGINQTVKLDSAQINRFSDRHFGIGFDQLLLVEPPTTSEALFKYRIFNADGGEVEQCGNGARCFAQFVRHQKLTEETLIPVETCAGLLRLRVIDDVRVEVNMGVPNFDPEHIPLDLPQRKASYSVSIGDTNVEFMALSIGNPHAVILVDDVDSANIEQIGSVMESHTVFPQRVNVGFMQIVNRQEFKLRVYERGVGETLACGSGACAAMAAACEAGLLDDQVRAHLRGGDLELCWRGEGMPVMMTGATAFVYDGEIEL